MFMKQPDAVRHVGRPAQTSAVIVIALALMAGSAKAQTPLRCEHGGDGEVVALSIARNNTGELRDAFGRRYTGFFAVTPTRAEGILTVTTGARANVLLDRASLRASIAWSRDGGIATTERTYVCAAAEKVF
jgi:hypothetical protein